MLKTLRVALAASVLAGGAVLASASPSAADPSADIVDITLDTCDVVVTFKVGDAGEYHLEVWDDSELIGDVPVTAAAQSQAVARYTLTAVVKQDASGLGIYIRGANGKALDRVDPYNGADDVIDFCAKKNPVPTQPPATEPPMTEPPAAPAPPVVVAPAATPVVADPTFTG
jgi:hypothetical protein